jgi:organic radical activating enzyme
MIYRDYLEYGLTYHCNLKCSNCAAYSPYLEEEYSNIESFKLDIVALSKVMHTKILRFVGGEPTLHPKLIEFISSAKNSGIADSVGICTNGIGLVNLPDEFFKIVDFIDISEYPETKINYEKISEFLKTKNVKFKCHENTQGYFIKFDSVHEQDAETTQRIFDNCYMAKTCHLFSDGRYYRCGVPIANDRYFKRIGRETTHVFTIEDGIPIHEPNLEERLLELTNSSIPLESCKFCLGPYGTKEIRKQLTTKEIKLFLKKS